MPKAVSKAQARFFGALAGGQRPYGGGKGMDPEEAKTRLRGVTIGKLPERVGSRHKKGPLYDLSKRRRGGR